MAVLGYHSATTGTHINAFLSLFGFPKATKQEMENWAVFQAGASS
jgi:hypothetical protein